MDLNLIYPLNIEVSANYSKTLFLSHPVKNII